MDGVPAFRFIASLMAFGLLMFVYEPVVDYLVSICGTPAHTMTSVIFFLWGALAAINLFASGIKLIMEMQRRSRGF